MESTRYEVLPSEPGWVIRRNGHDRAYCADPESALQLAAALAHGEHTQDAGATCCVWIRNEQGSWTEAVSIGG